jgi:hypothetical protein
MDTKTAEEQGPGIADGAIEMDIQKLLGIHGFVSGFKA